MDIMLLARSMGGLAAVLAMLAGALYLVRKYDIKLPGRVGGAQRGRLGIVERVTIDPKRSLLLVRKDGREHLLLISPEGHVIVDQAEAAAEAAAPVFSFAAQVEQAGSAAAVAPVVAAPAMTVAVADAPAEEQPSFSFEPWLEPANLPDMFNPANDRGTSQKVANA